MPSLDRYPPPPRPLLDPRTHVPQTSPPRPRPERVLCTVLVTTSCLGFKARMDYLCASLPACNGTLRFTSGATPAWHLVALSVHFYLHYTEQSIEQLVTLGSCSVCDIDYLQMKNTGLCQMFNIRTTEL